MNNKIERFDNEFNEGEYIRNKRGFSDSFMLIKEVRKGEKLFYGILYKSPVSDGFGGMFDKDYSTYGSRIEENEYVRYDIKNHLRDLFKKVEGLENKILNFHSTIISSEYKGDYSNHFRIITDEFGTRL
jgi:hypothetical protein